MPAQRRDGMPRRTPLAYRAIGHTIVFNNDTDANNQLD
jgi:hypothetical protein